MFSQSHFQGMCIASLIMFSLIPKGESFHIPKYAEKGDIFYEVELGIMLAKGGKNIKRPDWKSYIGGYFLLIDYTDHTML